MEPGEKFIRRLLKFVLMILVFVIAIVFGEFYRGMGWVGALIFIIGASMGAVGMYLLNSFKNFRVSLQSPVRVYYKPDKYATVGSHPSKNEGWGTRPRIW